MQAVFRKSIGFLGREFSVLGKGSKISSAFTQMRFFQPGSGEHIESLVKGRKVVMFMKGTPESPKCGFSNAVLQILKMHGVKDFEFHDVLASEEIRQGVKNYSSWPTIPQVFINGEFVGGCDIMIEMHQNGELVQELKKVGIESLLAHH